MVDIETRERILRDTSYGTDREYRGRYTRKEVLELLLKGYTCKEAREIIGIGQPCMSSHIASLKRVTNSSSIPSMLRKIVIKHRGYL